MRYLKKIKAFYYDFAETLIKMLQLCFNQPLWVLNVLSIKIFHMEIISKFLLSTKSVTDQFYRRTTSVTFQVDIHVLQKTYKIELLYKRDKFVCIITALRLTSVSKRIRKDMFKLYPVGAFCIIQRRFKQVVKQRQVVIWFMSSESWHAWFSFYVGRSILKITK